MKEIKIGNNYIGDGHKPFLILEIAQSHDGSLGIAHSYIDAAAEAGADAVKFQTHIAIEESTLDEPFRTKFSYQDASRFEYWKRMEFTEEQWIGLKKHADEKGLIFLSSGFSYNAIELLDRLGVPAFKLGSGEFKSFDLVNAICATNKPILYSTGMSTFAEIDSFYNLMLVKNYPIAIFQCTSKYPTQPNDIGLNVIADFKKRYSCPVGLSDHSGKIFAPILSLPFGTNIIEVHLTFHKKMFGPDTTSSLTIDECKLLRQAIDDYYEMIKSPYNKDNIAIELGQSRETFTKSISTVRDIKVGEVLSKNMIKPKKPGTGIPFDQLDHFLGKRFLNNVEANRIINLNDLE